MCHPHEQRPRPPGSGAVKLASECMNSVVLRHALHLCSPLMCLQQRLRIKHAEDATAEKARQKDIKAAAAARGLGAAALTLASKAGRKAPRKGAPAITAGAKLLSKASIRKKQKVSTQVCLFLPVVASMVGSERSHMHLKPQQPKVWCHSSEQRNSPQTMNIEDSKVHECTFESPLLSCATPLVQLWNGLPHGGRLISHMYHIHNRSHTLRV